MGIHQIVADNVVRTDRLMTIQYVSGLDWSGDAGDIANAVRSSPYLVVGMSHIHVTHRQDLSDAVHRLRDELRLPSQYVFKFARSSDRTREHFLDLLATLEISYTAAAIDRRRWIPAYVQHTSGSQRIVDAICAATESLPDNLVCGQRLLIDASKSDARLISDLRVALSRQQKARRRTSFSKIAPLPDDRGDALIIQAADFIAGYVGRNLVGETHSDDRLNGKLAMLRF